jgi:hypothetical protein
MFFQPGLTERLRSTSPLLARLLVGVLTLFAVTPFFLTLRPPLQDFPQHLAAGHVLLAPNDPELRFADYFSSEWLNSQYLGIYVLLGVFYHPLKWFVDQPLLVASRLSIVMLALCWVTSGEWLGWRLLRRNGVGLFFLVLFFNAHLILGFLNFLLGTAFCFFTICLFAEARARLATTPERPLSSVLPVAFGMTSLATFYFHVVPFALLIAVFVGAFVLDQLLPRVCRPRSGAVYRLELRHYVALLPAAVASGAWLFSPAGQSTRHAARGGDGDVRAVFTSAKVNTASLDAWLMDVFRSPWDTRLMYLAVGALLFYVAIEWGLQALSRNRRPPGGAGTAPDGVLIWLLRVGAPLCAIAYYVMPASFDWIWPINARFPLLALLLLPSWLPYAHAETSHSGWLRQVRAGLATTCLSVFGVASVGEATLARDAFQGFVKEMYGFDELLAAIPQGKKVATLVFDRGSQYVAFAPFLHVGAYYQAERGGVSYFSFNDFPQSPVRFLPADRPPKAKPRWEWRPEVVRPDEELGWFDYLIVRGGPPRLRATERFSERVRAGRFRLFQNNHTDDTSP